MLPAAERRGWPAAAGGAGPGCPGHGSCGRRHAWPRRRGAVAIGRGTTPGGRGLPGIPAHPAPERVKQPCRLAAVTEVDSLAIDGLLTTLGSVGIGTTNPATKLNVIGDARIEGFSNAKIQIKRTGNTVANGSIEFLGSDNSFGWGLIANNDAGGSNFNIKEGSVSRLYIKSGKIGINSTAPRTSLDIKSTDAVVVPVGTTGERPTPAAGMFRYNTTEGKFEGYTTEWGEIGGGGGITTEAHVANNAVVTLDLTAAVDHKVTATGICTITCTGGTEAQSHTIRIINSGSATVGFSTYFLFPSGNTPVLTSTDGAINLISFTVNRVGAAGTQLLAGASLNFS